MSGVYLYVDSISQSWLWDSTIHCLHRQNISTKGLSPGLQKTAETIPTESQHQENTALRLSIFRAISKTLKFYKVSYQAIFLQFDFFSYS